MMNCPLCGNAAHTRSSFQVSATTKERYNQCQNINCSCTFKSHETVSEIIMKPGSVKPVPPHPGRSQQQALWLWLLVYFNCPSIMGFNYLLYEP